MASFVMYESPSLPVLVHNLVHCDSGPRRLLVVSVLHSDSRVAKTGVAMKHAFVHRVLVSI